MICEGLSAKIGVRICIDKGHRDYLPNTAVRIADDFLQQNPTILENPLGRALYDDVSTYRLMAAALERHEAALATRVDDCQREIHGDGEAALDRARASA